MRDEQLVGERIEVGQEAGLGGRRQKDRLGMGGDRAGLIGAVERIGHQDRRAAGSAIGPALGRDAGEEQALARAVEDQHFGRRIDRPRQRESPPEPGRRRRRRTRRAPCSWGTCRTRRAQAASTGPTNDGTPCCGSPTARLIAGFPAGVSPKSSRSRTNGERMASARVGDGGVTGVRRVSCTSTKRRAHRRTRDFLP